MWQFVPRRFVPPRLVAGALLALVFALSGCERESKSGAGWASEVPADAVRFVRQESNLATAAPRSSETAEPVSDAAGAEQTETPSAPPAPRYAQQIKEPTKVVLWHAYRATEQDALKQVVDAFHALGTPVTIQLRAVPFDAFNDKIRVVVPRGRGPDLFIFAHDPLGAWAEMDMIEPLSNWVSAEDKQQFLPETVKALVYRNALYGLPLGFKSVALYYNKALVPEPPKTLEQLLALAKPLSDGERWGLVYESTNLYFHAPWLFAFGAGVLDAEQRPIIASPEADQALALVRSFVREHKITPMSVNTGMVSGYFNDGKAAMAINGPWMRGEIEGVDYGVAPLPSVHGAPAKPFLGVEAVFLNKQSQHKEAAVEVARFLAGPESAQIRYDVGSQPVSNRALWDAQGDSIDLTMKAFLDQSKTAVIMPSTPVMQQIWSPYNGALLACIAGDSTPDEALRKAQAEAIASIARARGDQ